MGVTVASCYWMELEVNMGDGIRTDTLTITPKILRQIAEIDEFKGAWEAIGLISPDRQPAWQLLKLFRGKALYSSNT